MISQALEKLNAESEDFKGNKGLLSPIYSYLLSILNDELAALILQDGYTLTEMISFVIEKARKELDGKSGALADDVVYGFTTDYYHSSREQIDELIKKKSTAAPRTITAPVAKDASADKKPEKEKKKTTAKPKQQEEEQLSLFDLIGGYANA